MNRSPSELRRMPPSPRAASESRMPELVDARRVELEELHVLHGDAPPVEQPGTVAGERVGVGRDLEHLPEAAGREQDALVWKTCRSPVASSYATAAATRRSAPSPSNDDVEHLVLVEEVDVALRRTAGRASAGSCGRCGRPSSTPAARGPRRGCGCGRRSGAGRCLPSGVRLNGRPKCSSSITASIASRHMISAAAWSTR